MGQAEDIARFEQQLQELVIKYEQYYVGIEKREPLRLLAEVEQWARRFTPVSITNTSLRFKYTALVSKLATYRQKWTRINRLIDEGKYERDRFKMELHSTATAKDSSKDEGAPRQESRPTLKDSQVEKLFHEYLEARKACNLPTDNVSRDKIAAAVQRQIPALVQKYGCKEVELRVVIEEGAPRIKARPSA